MKNILLLLIAGGLLSLSEFAAKGVALDGSSGSDGILFADLGNPGIQISPWSMAGSVGSSPASEWQVLAPQAENPENNGPTVTAGAPVGPADPLSLSFAVAGMAILVARMMLSV